VRLKAPKECTFTKGFKSHKFKLSPNDQVECKVGKKSLTRCEKIQPSGKDAHAPSPPI
jgi:hypothetical protein